MGEISYVHDGAGRLIAAEVNGQAAVYGYDDGGNLTVVRHHDAQTLAVIGFSPHRGPIGQSVRIVGTGFGPSSAGGVVRIGGVDAPVSSWGLTALIVRVPDGAATGPIEVTIP